MNTLGDKPRNSVEVSFHLRGDDFPITEVPGQRATAEQMSMFITRYRFLRDYCHGKEVLEVACGGGQGLAYLATVARRVVGADVDERLVPVVARRYRDRANISVHGSDAHQLPFEDKTFDVVALLDAIYWMKDQRKCIREARRVLRVGGRLVISTVNREWPEFCQSPYATRYLSASELVELVAREGFQPELFVAFETRPGSLRDKAVSCVRRLAVVFRLVPKSIRYKEILKRLFVGKLTPIPDEVSDEMGPYWRPVPIRAEEVGDCYKLLYVVGSAV